jgi:carboxyl-terminal processing protease
MKSTLLRTLGLVAASFAGGAVAAEVAHATAGAASPYAPLDQLARVLVLVENQYVEPAQRSKMIDGAIQGLVAELDPHSAYMDTEEYRIFQGDTEGKFGGVGVEVDYRDEHVTVIAPIEGSPAARAGIRPGDQIIAVDGRSTRGERVDKLITRMRGPAGSRVTVTVRRAGVPDPITLELVREEIHVASVVGKRLEGEVAYLRLKQFQEGTHEELLRAIGALRAESKTPLSGVLVDMRNNPGGLVDEAEAVADELLASGTIYSTRHRGRVVDEASAHDGGALASLPAVVLVNEHSASSAELVAGALQDNRRALVIGRPTFGKGSVQTIFDLPGGAGLRLTTMRYYTPSGRSIQAEGIRPDVLVEPDKPEPGALVVRERDLEGHLAAEPAPAGGARASVVVTGGGGERAAPAPLPQDVPRDPTRGDDFALAVAYRELRKLTR